MRGGVERGEGTSLAGGAAIDRPRPDDNGKGFDRGKEKKITEGPTDRRGETDHRQKKSYSLLLENPEGRKEGGS